jgi:hypothetical protein
VDALDFGVQEGDQSTKSANRVFTVPDEKIFAVQYRQINRRFRSGDQNRRLSLNGIPERCGGLVSRPGQSMG